jgi:tRNA (cytidine/uridine-2'-O-)-methyltransferase
MGDVPVEAREQSVTHQTLGSNSWKIWSDHVKTHRLQGHWYVDLHRQATFLAAEQPAPARLFALTTRGTQAVHDVAFAPGDWLVFGSETRGLAPELRETFPPAQRLKLPMVPGQRSLNLSNAVAVTVFEAWRQNQFQML